MKIAVLSFITLLFLSTAATAQSASGKYVKYMYSKLLVLDTTQSKEVIESLFEDFSRMAAMEKTNWQPYYYMAYCKTRIALGNVEQKVADELLTEANKYCITADSLSKKNSEILALKSRIMFSKIPLGNVVERTPKYGAIAKSLAQTAVELNPDNPRAHIALGLYYANLPSFIGGDKQKGCDCFKTAKEKYKGKKRGENDITVYWGEVLADMFIKQCGK